MWFYLSDCIANKPTASKTQIFVEEHAPRAPKQCFKQLPLKTQNPSLFCQNIRGQTAHNRPSSGNLLGEKEAFYIWRQASWVYYHLFTWWNYCVSLYLWTVEKSCGSDCIIKSLATFLEKRRHSIFEDKHPGCTITYSLDEIIVWVCIYELSRKVVVVIALSKVWLNSSLNLVSSCKMYSVISPSRCMDHRFLSLVPRLSQHKASPIHGPVHSPGFVVTLYFSAFSNSSTPILVGKCLVDDSSCGSSTCNPCCQRNIF